MILLVTRGSVCAADDVDAPHEILLSIPDSSSAWEIARNIQEARYLPIIEGGEATWSVESGVPLAVIAQQWLEPQVVFEVDLAKERVLGANGDVKVHIFYHAQIDPGIVLKQLREFRPQA